VLRESLEYAIFRPVHPFLFQLFQLLTPSVVYMSELLVWDTSLKHHDVKRRGGPEPDWDVHNSRFRETFRAGLDGLCFDRLVTGMSATSFPLKCSHPPIRKLRDLVGLERRGAHCFTASYRSPGRHVWWAFRHALLVGSAHLPPTKGSGDVDDVAESLWGRDAKNAVKMLIVLKTTHRIIENSDEIVPAIAEKFDTVRVTHLAIEKLSFSQQFEAIGQTDVLLAQTGTASLTLGVMMAQGSVLIEILEGVGLNHSVSSCGWFVWPSVPYIHVRLPRFLI
jgi:hypothetical protein